MTSAGYEGEGVAVRANDWKGRAEFIGRAPGWAWSGRAIGGLALAGVLAVSVPAWGQGSRSGRASSATLGDAPAVAMPDGDLGAPPAAIAPMRLEWTPNPGAFEDELRRRVANPLFSSDRQVVLPAELRAAKIRDAEEARAVLAEVVDLALDRNKLARAESLDEIEPALARHDELIRTALGVGGEALPLADSVRRSRAALVVAWRERNAESPEILAALTAHAKSFDDPAATDPFVAQLLREDGPIPPDEVASALLSEPPATMALALDALPSGARKSARSSGLALLEQVESLGVEIEDGEAKRAILQRSGG